MASTLTASALKELELLLVDSRRELSAVYREWKAGMTPQAMAEARGHPDLKQVKDHLSGLRVLFGRETLPKRGRGRQKAIYEAEYWLKSDFYLSPELTEHFEKILLKAEKTNTRRNDYDPPLPPRSVYKQARDKIASKGDFPGVYVVTKESFLASHLEGDRPLIVKVGWSSNVWDRLAGAQTWDPDPLKVLRVFPTRTPNVLEAKIHIVLDTLGCAYEGSGGKEWFSIVAMELTDSAAKQLGLVPENLD